MELNQILKSSMKQNYPLLCSLNQKQNEESTSAILIEMKDVAFLNEFFSKVITGFQAFSVQQN